MLMLTTSNLAEIAALVGDPARAAMLHTLMDGRALTATELSAVAGVTPQTASGHLGRLSAAGLLTVEHQGRHRYHRLANASVAAMIESIMEVAASQLPRSTPLRTGPRDIALKTARTCYDHIAGMLGVALADSLVAAGRVELSTDAAAVTPAGLAFFSNIGIELGGGTAGQRPSHRPLCRTCLDWSERRSHLAGRLGKALCTHCLTSGWVRQQPDSRALLVTPAGHAAFHRHFGITLLG